MLRGRSGGLEGSLGVWRSSDSASARMLFHAGGVLSDKVDVGASRDTVRETVVSINVGE